MGEFLAMGGYAWYVWMAYGFAAAVVVVEVVAVRARRRRAFDALKMSLDAPMRSPSMARARPSR
jgi:heme exporter protein D